MKKHRIIILEGLPGVGKSTITKSIINFDPNIVPVNEIINEEIFDNVNLFQEMYFKNDNMKVQKARDSKKAIIDRGPISTFSYNQVRSILDKNFEFYDGNYGNTKTILEDLGEEWKSVILSWGTEKFNEYFDCLFYLNIEEIYGAD